VARSCGIITEPRYVSAQIPPGGRMGAPPGRDPQRAASGVRRGRKSYNGPYAIPQTRHGSFRACCCASEITYCKDDQYGPAENVPVWLFLRLQGVSHFPTPCRAQTQNQDRASAPNSWPMRRLSKDLAVSVRRHKGQKLNQSSLNSIGLKHGNLCGSKTPCYRRPAQRTATPKTANEGSTVVSGSA
jgi:hypothetical protein